MQFSGQDEWQTNAPIRQQPAKGETGVSRRIDDQGTGVECRDCLTDKRSSRSGLVMTSQFLQRQTDTNERYRSRRQVYHHRRQFDSLTPAATTLRQAVTNDVASR